MTSLQNVANGKRTHGQSHTDTHTHTLTHSHTYDTHTNTGPPAAFQFWHLFGLSSWLSFLFNLTCLRFHAALAILCRRTQVVEAPASTLLSCCLPSISPRPSLSPLWLSLVVVAAVTVACLFTVLYLFGRIFFFVCTLLFAARFQGREIEFESLSDILVIKSEIFATLLFSTFS